MTIYWAIAIMIGCMYALIYNYFEPTKLSTLVVLGGIYGGVLAVVVMLALVRV